MKHLISNKLLTDSQHCFRSGSSVETNLIHAYDYITELLDHDTPVDIILLNYANVCHHHLKTKLTDIGIYPKVVECVI